MNFWLNASKKFASFKLNLFSILPYYNYTSLYALYALSFYLFSKLNRILPILIDSLSK